MKKIAIIPTLLTLGNAVCGFAAIALASKINSGNPDTNIYFVYAAWLIFGAMVFDGLDGYVARISRTQSEFGKQLDSLCDAISFGVAPGFLLMRMGQGWEHPMIRQAVAVIAALYMCCAILRLARYNVEAAADPTAGKKFKGLPSPGAAGCMAAMAMLFGDLNFALVGLDADRVHAWATAWAPLGTLLVALLMVSQVPYPHFTKSLVGGRKHLGHLVELLLLIGMLVVAHELALFLLFWGYAMGMPVRYFIYRKTKGTSRAGASQPGLDDAARR